MTLPLKAPRYLAQFQCLAQECPDTCCAGFVVRLERSDLARLDSAVGQSKDLLARRKGSIEEERGEDGAVASLHQGDGCAFLDADKLCALIKRKGQDGIPDACALYPRTLSYFPEHVELRATAGCPQIARSLVLDKAPLEVVDVESGAAARIPEAGKRPPPSPYSARRDELISLGDVLLGRDGSGQVKLAALAQFGGEVEETFHRKSRRVDDERWAAAAKRLGSSRGIASAARWMKGVTADDRVIGAQVIFGLLMNLREGGSRRYGTLLDAALATYQRALPPEAEENVFGGLALAFQQRAEAIDQAIGAELDPPLSRFVHNEWHRVWFTQSRSLLAHLFKLSLEVAAIRVVLLGHPAVEAYAVTKTSDERARRLPDFQQALIDGLQIVSRRIGSSDGLLDVLEEQLSPKDLGTDPAGRLRLVLAYC